jgi:hypothetical protein
MQTKLRRLDQQFFLIFESYIPGNASESMGKTFRNLFLFIFN